MQSLGLFVKHPRPGQVKSRLAVATSSEWAARVADAFLRDALERLPQVPAGRHLVYSPRHEEEFFAGLAQGRFELVPQAEGDLGRRMETFIAGQMRAGAERVVVVGSDSPTMPVSFVEKAFVELERADVVLGPATDGGYYLLGCAGRLPPIFANIAWGTERVLVDTLACFDSSWHISLLPPWYDVDTMEDWWTLKGHVKAMRQAGLDPRIPHTERLLEGTMPCTSRPS